MEKHKCIQRIGANYNKLIDLCESRNFSINDLLEIASNFDQLTTKFDQLSKKHFCERNNSLSEHYVQLSFDLLRLPNDLIGKILFYIYSPIDIVSLLMSCKKLYGLVYRCCNFSDFRKEKLIDILINVKYQFKNETFDEDSIDILFTDLWNNPTIKNDRYFMIEQLDMFYPSNDHLNINHVNLMNTLISSMTFDEFFILFKHCKNQKCFECRANRIFYWEKWIKECSKAEFKENNTNYNDPFSFINYCEKNLKKYDFNKVPKLHQFIWKLVSELGYYKYSNASLSIWSDVNGRHCWVPPKNK